jgi:hypothetical protein
MRILLILCTALIVGCQSGKDPFVDAYWALTRDGWPALCVPGDELRCITPAREDRIHYIDGMCGINQSGI